MVDSNGLKMYLCVRAEVQQPVRGLDPHSDGRVTTALRHGWLTYNSSSLRNPFFVFAALPCYTSTIQDGLYVSHFRWVFRSRWTP
jgi:hypothetical protein